MTSQHIVHLNIGGSRYSTSISTIMKYPGSMLATMIEQENERRSIEEGKELFIDRDGSVFSHVLEYLRNGERMILPNDENVLEKLLLEADFFQLSDFEALVKEHKVGCTENFKIGAYVKVVLHIPKAYAREIVDIGYIGVPYYTRKGIYGQDVISVKVETERAAKGIFDYDELRRKIALCPHHGPMSIEEMERTINLMARLKTMPHNGMNVEWTGKIVALRDACAVVKFCYASWQNEVKSGMLLLHVPQSILEKA